MKTGHKPRPPVSYIGKFQPLVPDSEAIKREAWRNGILAVDINDERLDFVDKEFIQHIGEVLHGKKLTPPPQKPISTKVSGH